MSLPIQIKVAAALRAAARVWRAGLRPARWLFAAAVGVVAALSVPLVAAGTPSAAHASQPVPSRLVASQPTVTEGATDADGTRLLAGVDRYATAVLLAGVPLDAGDAATREVLVVSGESLVDAVSAVSVAASRDAAIVLTATDAVPQVVAEFIAERGFDGVTVGGGTAAVSDTTADELAALVSNANDDGGSGGESVPRVAGATRFETAVAAARAAGDPGVWCDGRTAAVLVSGESLVDGVIAAPVAYAMGLPLLFTEPDALPDVVEDYLAEASIERAVTVGATSDISGAVLAQLGAAGVATVAFDAATPAERSVELVEAIEGCATQPVAPGEFALLDANQPVDGVAAAAALATGLGEHSDSDTLIPILAVSQNSLPQPVADYLAQVGRRHNTITLYPLGGVARLTPRVIGQAVGAAEGKPLVGVPPDERWPVGSEARAEYLEAAGAWVAPPGAMVVTDARFTNFGTPRAGVPTSRRLPQGAPVAPDSLNRQDYTFAERQTARERWWNAQPPAYQAWGQDWRFVGDPADYPDDIVESMDNHPELWEWEYVLVETARPSFALLWDEYQVGWQGYRNTAHSMQGDLGELDAEWWFDWAIWGCRTLQGIVPTVATHAEMYTRQLHAFWDALHAAMPDFDDPFDGPTDEVFEMQTAAVSSVLPGQLDVQMPCVEQLTLQEIGWPLRDFHGDPRSMLRNAAIDAWTP